MAIAKRKIEKSRSITVKIDGSLDVRFTLERRPQEPWTVGIETSEDGEDFEPIKTSESMHPAVLLAASAPAVQALVAEFE